MRPLPLALRQRRFSREPRVVDILVSRVERDFLLSMERCGVDRKTLFRVVLPLARAEARVLRDRGAADRLVAYLLEKARQPPTGGSTL